MGTSLPKLEKKLKDRTEKRDRQIRRFKKTKDRGHAKAAHRQARAVKYLKWLIAQKKAEMTLAEKAAKIGLGLVGVMEQGGNNAGPMVSKIIKANDGFVGEPWCGDFVAYCYRLAGSDLVNRSWASVQALDDQPGIKETTKPREGDLVTFDFDHVGMFLRDLGNGEIETVEGNTGASGAVSDSATGGDGVYRKKRSKSLVSEYLRVTD